MIWVDGTFGVPSRDRVFARTLQTPAIYEERVVKSWMQKSISPRWRFPSPSASLGASPRPSLADCDIGGRFSEPEAERGLRFRLCCDLELGRQDGRRSTIYSGSCGDASEDTREARPRKQYSKGTPPFTLTRLDGVRAIGSWPVPGSSQVVLTILQLDSLVAIAVCKGYCMQCSPGGLQSKLFMCGHAQRSQKDSLQLPMPD